MTSQDDVHIVNAAPAPRLPPLQRESGLVQVPERVEQRGHAPGLDRVRVPAHRAPAVGQLGQTQPGGGAQVAPLPGQHLRENICIEQKYSYTRAHLSRDGPGLLLLPRAEPGGGGEQRAQQEADRPHPLRALVVVCAVGGAGVGALVRVVVVAAVRPVLAVQRGEACACAVSVMSTTRCR